MQCATIIAPGWVSDIDGETIIAGIEAGFGGEATIFGGMAGDDQTLVGPMVFTLQLERANAPAVMRTAMLGNTEDRSLVCAGHIPQGAKVRFSLPPDFDVIDTVVGECTEVRENDLQDADALIMFSCVSRYLSFGELIKEEIEQVQKVWDAPMVGFFTYGEYGKSKIGNNEFHNNCCCVVALKEKIKSDESKINQRKINRRD